MTSYPDGLAGSARSSSHRGVLPLTPLMGIVVVSVLSLVGATADVALGNEVRPLFGVGFGVGAGLAVLLVERRDIVRTIVWIPLVYVALLLVGTGVSGHNDPVSWLVLAVVFKAPVVLIGTAVAVVLGGARGLLARYSR